MFSKTHMFLLCSITILKMGFCAAPSSLCQKRNLFPIERVYPDCNECCWNSFRIAANIAQYTLCSKIQQFKGQSVAESSENILKNIYDLGKATLKIARNVTANCSDCKAVKYVVCDFAARVRCFNNVLASCDRSKAIENLNICVSASETAAAANIKTLSQACQDAINKAVSSILSPIQSYYTDAARFQADLPAVVGSNCC